MRMKHFQAGGGGKFSPEYKANYLEHCRLIILDNNIVSRDFLLAELHKDVIKAINEIEEYSSIKEELSRSIEIIFGSINLNDPNSVGVVNVVSLQCSTLFTYACLGFNQPTSQDFYNLNSLNQKFLEFTNNVPYNELTQNRTRDWRYYENIDKTRGLLYDLYSKNSNKPRGIITILDYLTLDEILLPYLNNWYICGIVYKKTFADGRFMIPFGFTEHDITHFNNYDGICFSRNGEDINKMRKFFDYINRIENREIKYLTKIIFFLNLHESWCEWDSLSYNNGRFWSGLLRIERLFNDNDLGLLIPKRFRENEESRRAYIERALTTYTTQIGIFNSRSSAGGSKKILYRLTTRRRRTKKGKKNKKNKSSKKSKLLKK